MWQTVKTVEPGSTRYECAMCHVPVTMTEKNGLGYCDKHWRVVHPQRLRRLVGKLRRAPTPPRFTRRATS